MSYSSYSDYIGRRIVYAPPPPTYTYTNAVNVTCSTDSTSSGSSGITLSVTGPTGYTGMNGDMGPTGYTGIIGPTGPSQTRISYAEQRYIPTNLSSTNGYIKVPPTSTPSTPIEVYLYNSYAVDVNTNSSKRVVDTSVSNVGTTLSTNSSLFSSKLNWNVSPNILAGDLNIIITQPNNEYIKYTVTITASCLPKVNVTDNTDIVYNIRKNNIATLPNSTYLWNFYETYAPNIKKTSTFSFIASYNEVAATDLNVYMTNISSNNVTMTIYAYSFRGETLSSYNFTS